MEKKKVFYSIGEVSEQLALSISLLRYWETEFEMLKPFRNKKGTRFYAEKDIDMIRKIAYLTKECGYTLEGAREQLRIEKKGLSNKAEAVESLKKIRAFLLELKAELE